MTASLCHIILTLGPLYVETEAQVNLNDWPKRQKLLDGRATIGTQVCTEVIQCHTETVSRPALEPRPWACTPDTPQPLSGPLLGSLHSSAPQPCYGPYAQMLLRPALEPVPLMPLREEQKVLGFGVLGWVNTIPWKALSSSFSIQVASWRAWAYTTSLHGRCGQG